MLIKQTTSDKLNNNSLEGLSKTNVAEIKKLENLIDSSLREIKEFKVVLENLEEDLNHFFNWYYEYIFFL